MVTYVTIYESKTAALDVFLTGMQIFTFMSVVAKIRGFTPDKTGKSLPAMFAPWYTVGGTETMVAVPTDPVARAMRRDGYFLVSGDDSPGRRPAGRRPSPRREIGTTSTLSL
jgi:hypothetical protein